VEEELRKSEESFRELASSLQIRIEEEISRRMSQERLLAKNSRLAAMGEMISAIAHQWRQPLATLAMMIQRTHAVGTRQGLTTEYLDTFKANAMGQIRYMSDTIEEFRGFYRPEKQKEPFSPLACITDSARLFEHQFSSNGITVSVNFQDCDTRLVKGFPNEFKQVVLNLLSNSRDAILESRSVKGGPDEGKIAVRIWVAGGSGMSIEVSDNGCGIPEAIAPRIFDPYFTTKEETGGTGIGLYMSRMIVEDSLGGQLNLMQSPIGATFRIELPLEEQP
jgi:signal transduction histidine kinase